MSIPKVSIEQIKAARALLRWSQSDHSNNSGVSLPTIKRLEAAGGTLGGLKSTSDKLVTSLENAGVVFLPENGEGLGVRLRKKPHGTN